MCEISNKISKRRKELGLTLEDVGKAVGVGRSTVQRWESGLIKNMGRDKIAALAKVLQMSPVEFVPGDVQPRNADQDIIDALHQNPKLRLLFNIQKDLDDSDLNAVLGVVNAIAKERGDDD